MTIPEADDSLRAVLNPDGGIELSRLRFGYRRGTQGCDGEDHDPGAGS